jgi:hypothetical protein
MRAVGVVPALVGGFGIVLTMGVSPGRGSWPRALVVAIASAVLGGLLTWAAVALWQATGGGPLGAIGLLAPAGAWLYTTAFMAGLAASSE